MMKAALKNFLGNSGCFTLACAMIYVLCCLALRPRASVSSPGMSRAISSTYFSWSQSNTSSVKPCRQPSGTQIKRTGKSMALSQTAASISSEMCLILTATSERFLQPRIVGCKARAIYCSIMVPLQDQRFSAGPDSPLPSHLKVTLRTDFRPPSFCNIGMTGGNAVAAGVKHERLALVVFVLLNLAHKNDVVTAVILANFPANELGDGTMKERHSSGSFLKLDSSKLVGQRS